jgi:hypothetical protein
MAENGTEKNAESDYVEPEHKPANEDHPAVPLRLGYLSGFLPINPECHPHGCSRSETPPVASAIRSDRKQPDQRGQKRDYDNSDEH